MRIMPPTILNDSTHHGTHRETIKLLEKGLKDGDGGTSPPTYNAKHFPLSAFDLPKMQGGKVARWLCGARVEVL